jgi:hypothetical protein
MRPASIKPSLLVLGVYLALTLILTYPLPANLTTTVPNDIGDPLLNTWILAWDTHALLTNPLNLFNANIFYPLPNTLAFSEHLFSTALLALPIQLISGEPILAYNLSLLATFPLAAFGTYLLALRWTRHRSAAFIAGFIFAFAPYRFAAIAHLQLLTFQWLPFALFFLDKILINYQLPITNYQLSIPNPQSPIPNPQSPITNYHHTLAFTLFLALQLLASWYLAVYTLLIIGVYIIFALLARRLARTIFIKLAVTLLITAGLTIPFILPYLPLLEELRQARPLSLALSFAAAPTDYLAAAPSNRIFGSLTATFRTRPNFTEENMLFVGLVAPALATLTILMLLFNTVLRITYSVNSTKPSNLCTTPHSSLLTPHSSLLTPHSSFIVLLLSLALTFALPYTLVAALIPPSTIIRVPSRWIIPALFALAGLSAFGYAIINEQLNSRVTHHASRLMLLVVALLLAETFSAPIPLAPVENRTQLNPAYHWLANQPADFALIELPLRAAPAPEFPEVKRLYASTLGWWPLVNGYSGYTPLRQTQLTQTIATFPNEQAIASLQNLTTEIQQFPPPETLNSELETPWTAQGRQNSKLYLLIHPGETPFDRTQWETVGRWQAERNPTLYPLGQFEGDYLYQVIPDNPDRFPAPPLATFGPNQEIQLLNFNYQLPITNYQTQNPELKTQNSKLLLYWRPTTPLPTDYTVFIHLRAGDGFVRSQADGPPVSNHYPTTAWQPGEIIQDIHPLPNEDFGQIDHLAIGLYNPATGERLPAFDAAGKRLADDAVIIPLH